MTMHIAKPEVQRNDSQIDTPNAKMSAQKMVFWGVVTSGGLVVATVYGPVIVSALTAKGIVTAATAAAAKTGAVIKTACITAGPVATKVNLAIVGAKLGKRILLPAEPGPREKLQAFIKQEETEFSKAREDFERCLINNNVYEQGNRVEIPSACAESAMMFAMLAHTKKA